MLKIIKKIFIYSVTLLSLNIYANVAQSGKWSSASTWSEGSVPTSSKDLPYTSLTLNSDNITLQVDSDQWIDRINIGSFTNTTISIDSGKTLNLGGCTTPKEYISSSNATNTLLFSGNGTLAIGFANLSDAVIAKSTVIFDVNVTASRGGNLLYANGESNITIKKNFDGSSGQLNFAGATVNLESGATLKGGFLIATGNTNFKQNSTIAFGSANMGSLKLDSNMTLNGVRNYETELFALRLAGTSEFGENASIKSTSTNSKAVFQHEGTLTSFAKENAISFSGKMYLKNNSSLILNSSNAFKVQGANSQGSSNFNLINYYVSYDRTLKVQTENFTATTATIKLGANNDFGSFTYYNGSTLNLETNGHMATIGKFIEYSEGSSFQMNISKHQDFTLMLMSLDGIGTYEDGNSLRAYNIITENEELGADYAYLLYDETLGGWWINITNTIPEPSRIASILGIFSLLLILIKKNN